MSPVHSNLALLRQRRGFSVAHLASMVGVSRQTIYAMEAGSYVPNTLVALRLSKALSVSVEGLFRLEESTIEPPPAEEAELLAPHPDVEIGQPLQLCRVEGRLVATPPEPGTWSLPSADGVVLEKVRASKRPSRVRVRILDEGRKLDRRVLIAGCDPGASVLARHLQRQGVELVVAYQNSSRSLELLKEGVIHIAGTHIRDDKTGESNLPRIKKMFGEDSVAVISFALWEEGITVAPGNPKGIKGIADLARSDVTIMNREPGAGSRVLLDSLLGQQGIRGEDVHGYGQHACGHLPSAREVQVGKADCCINTSAAARVFGLGFIPLVSKRYDFVVHRKHLELPQMEAVFDTLSRAKVRLELDGLGGYDMTTAGDRLF